MVKYDKLYGEGVGSRHELDLRLWRGLERQHPCRFSGESHPQQGPCATPREAEHQSTRATPIPARQAEKLKPDTLAR